MHIAQVDMTNRRKVKRFLDLPYVIYRELSPWARPLSGDAARMLDRNKNPYHRHSEAVFFMALQKEGRAARRLAVLDNHRNHEYNHKKTSFFYFFEWNEASGLQTENDLASGYLNSQMVLPERILQARDLIRKRRGLRVSAYKSRKDLRTPIPCLQSLYNISWAAQPEIYH